MLAITVIIAKDKTRLKVKNMSYKYERRHWKSIRRSIKRRLIQSGRFICSNCMESEQRKLTIHHIVPFGDGGVDIENNRVVLCEKCHSRVHSLMDIKRNIELQLRIYAPFLLRGLKRNA